MKKNQTKQGATRHNAKFKQTPSKAKAVAPALKSSEQRRYPVPDALRGVAILLMVIYHFCYDLVFLRLVYFDFTHDPFWLSFRYSIVTLFVGLVGFSLVLATQQGIHYRRFGWRLAWLCVCAVLVTVASLYLFPQRFIFFGVLHFIALASVLGLLFIRFQHLNLLLGVLFISLGIWGQHPFFDQQPWQFFGMMTHKPATEDYVPLLPWFGVVLLGMYAAQQALAHDWLSTKVLPPWTCGLTWAGRHSLWIYMLHQPLLLGMMSAWLMLF